jgi:hypothetical protein
MCDSLWGKLLDSWMSPFGVNDCAGFFTGLFCGFYANAFSLEGKAKR